MLPEQDFPSLRVLAADDNRTNLHILSVFLKKLGHEVLTADNGQEAVECFEREAPDLVLLDIMMPVMDGFEAARRIKARSQAQWVPIIFLSALNRDENLVEGLEAGGDDYLTKPINFVVLEAKMRSMQRALHLQRQSTETAYRLAAISDAVLEAVITIDTLGTVLSANAAASDIFGWTQEELLGQNIKILMPDPYHSEHDGYLARYVQGGEPRMIGSDRELTGRRKNGEVFPIELGISEIRLNQERVFVGVVRDISARKAAEQELRANAEKLRTYYDQNEAEQTLAKGLLDKQLHRPGLKHPRLRYSVRAADNFSGDIVAALESPQGKLYALLADATGHGLAAAISVLPVLTLFYRLSARDLPLADLIEEINQQLRESMPIGRFVAATFVCVDLKANSGEIWIGGTPSAMLLDAEGNIQRTFDSTQLPLGIVDIRPGEAPPESFILSAGQQLVLCSDGLFEAEDPQGAQFGVAGLQQAVRGIHPQQRFDTIQDALARHLGERSANDDISLMLVDGA